MSPHGKESLGQRLIFGGSRGEPEAGDHSSGIHDAIESPIENLEVYNDDTYGVLKISLKERGYEWRFVPEKGETFTDSGSARCTP